MEHVAYHELKAASDKIGQETLVIIKEMKKQGYTDGQWPSDVLKKFTVLRHQLWQIDRMILGLYPLTPLDLGKLRNCPQETR